MEIFSSAGNLYKINATSNVVNEFMELGIKYESTYTDVQLTDLQNYFNGTTEGSKELYTLIDMLDIELTPNKIFKMNLEDLNINMRIKVEGLRIKYKIYGEYDLSDELISIQKLHPDLNLLQCLFMHVTGQDPDLYTKVSWKYGNLKCTVNDDVYKLKFNNKFHCTFQDTDNLLLPAYITNNLRSWFCDDELHNNDPYPACINIDNDYKVWCCHGQPYYNDFHPSLIYPDGTKYWSKGTILHNDPPYPAVIYPDGRKDYYVDGKLIKSE